MAWIAAYNERHGCAQAHAGLSRELEAKERLEGPDLARWLAQVVAPHSLRAFVLQGVIPSLARR
jgi:hypothetical protein